MRFEDFIARPALLSHLRDTFGTGRVYHAYIFAGPEGTGKKTMAALCAQALYCRAEQSMRPCGICEACTRFLSGDTPDDRVLRVPEDKTTIPVENVRILTDSLSDRAFGGSWRTVRIEDADRMGDSAQNALLKTLEEPPADVVFFLITQSVRSLLPTVVSRCRVIRFTGLTEAEITAELTRRGIATNTARRAAALANGALGIALRLSQDEAYQALAADVEAAWHAANEPGGIVKASALLKDRREDAQEVFALFEALAQSLMHRGDGAGARLMRAELNARKRVHSNVAWQYVMEQMLLETAEGTRSI